MYTAGLISRLGVPVNVQNAAFDPQLHDPGLQARFRVAARHSLLVRVLRVAVPTAVGLAMAMIIWISVGIHVDVKTDNLSGTMIVSGSKITMETPHMSGYTPDQRPYEVWAKTAVQDVADPDHVQLNILNAKVLMEDRSTTTLDAQTGMFDTKQQQLDLRKDVHVRTSTGYVATLDQAFVDMAKGTVTSDEHVDVKLTNGTLTADRLRITGNGEVVRFEGNVVMNLDNLGGDPAQTASAAEAPSEPANVPAPAVPKKPRSGAKPANTK